IIVEAVLVRAADAQPGVRAGHVHAAGHRVEEVGAAAAPGGTEAFWHTGGHGGLVEPPPRRGTEVTGLAATVEQVEYLVGRRRGVGRPARGRVGRRHRLRLLAVRDRKSVV